MSTTFKGLVASLTLTTSIFTASGSASADVLASIGLDEFPQQCDLRLTRRALALDLSVPENLSGVTEVFCGCEVVSVQMLDFIRRNRHLEVLLDETSEQCGGFANVLANVSTASIGGTSTDGRENDRLNNDDDGGAGLVDGDAGDKDTDNGAGGDTDGGTDSGTDGATGNTDTGDKGTSGGKDRTDDGDTGSDDGDKGSDDGDNGSDDGDKGSDDGDKGSDDGDKGSDDGDKGSDDGDDGHKGGKGDKGDKGKGGKGKGDKGGRDRDHHHGHEKDC